MSYEFLTLRLVHILGGVFWVGGGIYAALFSVPAITALGPAAGPVFAELQRRKLFTVIPVVALLTMLSGLRLLWIVSGGYQWTYFQTRSGMTFGLAGLASILGFCLALFVSRPASARLGMLTMRFETMSAAERAAAAAEMPGLKARAGIATAVSVGLVVLTTLGMAVARYL